MDYLKKYFSLLYSYNFHECSADYNALLSVENREKEGVAAS